MRISNEIFNTKFLTLQKLMQKEMPFNLSKILMKNIEELREGQKEFETARLKIAQNHAKKDKNNRFIIKDWKYEFDKQGEKEFKKEHDKLLKIEREYNIELITLPDDFKIAPSDLLILKDIIIKL